MKEINTYYFNKVNNFGDILNEKFLADVFQVKPIHTDINQAKLVCIGSLLESFLYAGENDIKLLIRKALYPKTYIFGTGFIAKENERIKRPKNKKENFLKKMEVIALRGYNTKARVERIVNKDLSKIALGDPGLLAYKLLKDEKILKKYQIGIIPHYIDKDNPLINKLQSSISDSVIINVLDDPIKVIQQIAACECIVSSAMHGLIVADSLGIPNQRIIVSDKIIGGDYMFDDYYSVFNIITPPKIDLRKSDKVSILSIINNYNVDPKMVSEIQEKLINVFPF